MNYMDFEVLVRRMRQAQRAYYKESRDRAKKHELLVAAIAIEAEVDRALAQMGGNDADHRHL